MTPAQQRVLRFISDFFYEHFRSPTYREIKEGLGIKSVSSVHRRVLSLEREGMLSREPHRSYSISLTSKGLLGDGCMIAIPGDLRALLERRAREVSEAPALLAVKAIAAYLKGRVT